MSSELEAILLEQLSWPQYRRVRDDMIMLASDPQQKARLERVVAAIMKACQGEKK